jgi:tetratricopeptide (TPR) repeat protein
MVTSSPDFFISYAAADEGWARWIAWQLRAAGYATIIQTSDFKPGADFVHEMQRATMRARRTIAVLSPAYFESRFGAAEWHVAFSNDPTGEQGALVPVRVRACEPRGLLAARVYIDLVGKSEPAARDTLLVGVAATEDRPNGRAEFPGSPVTSESQPSFPGRRPTVWNLPQPRNALFYGRSKLLEALYKRLHSGASESVAVVTLTGLGGVGKTQLMAEYAHQHEDEYDVVWWMAADNPGTLAHQYASLAEDQGLNLLEAAGTPDVLDHVRAWLELHDRWLLLFDNADSVQAVQAYLPRRGSGHVVITSRNPIGRPHATPIPVDVWLREEAVGFLVRRTDNSDAEAAYEIARLLGDLPLALEQAGAFIDELGISLAAYLRLVQDRLPELLDAGKPAGHEHTIGTVWAVSFEQVEASDPAAADLLRLLAFLGPVGLPIKLLRQGAGVLPARLARALEQPGGPQELLAIPRKYSLVKVADDSIALHLLVQAVSRTQLRLENVRFWCTTALRWVLTHYPDDSRSARLWSQCERLLPHALQVIDHARAYGIEPQLVAVLLDRVIAYLHAAARHGEVKALLERALAIDEEVHGATHPTIAAHCGQLARVLQDLGDLAGARAQLERALAIDEEVHGATHPAVALRCNNLALLLRKLGDLSGAKARLERALAIDEEVHGATHPAVALRRANLGLLLRDLGDLPGAKAQLERALVIDEAVHGAEHPEVALRRSDLGLLLHELGDETGASGQLEQALAIDEAVYGATHPVVAVRCGHLARVLRNLGDLGGAKALLERALEIDEAAHGVSYPPTALNRNDLALLLLELGDPIGAKMQLKHALALAEAAHGAGHQITKMIAANLQAVEKNGHSV